MGEGPYQRQPNVIDEAMAAIPGDDSRRERRVVQRIHLKAGLFILS